MVKMKKKLRKFTAAALAAVLAVSVTACYSEENLWAAKKGDEVIPIGGYIYYLQGAYSSAREKVGAETKVLKAEIDGKPAKTWIDEEAVASVKQYYYLFDKFNELGLSFSEEDQKEIKSNVDSLWGYYGATFTKDGVSYDSMKKVYAEHGQRFKLVMQAMYSEGGEKALSDADMTKFYDDTYYRYETLAIPLVKPAASSEETSSADTSSVASTVSEAEAQTQEMTDDEKMEVKLEIDTMLKDVESGGKTLEELAQAYKDAHPEAADKVVYSAPQSVQKESASTDVQKKLLEAKENAFIDAVEETETLTIGRRLPSDSKEVLADSERRISLLSEMKSEELQEIIKEAAKNVEGIEFNESAMKKQKIDRYVLEENEKGTSSASSSLEEESSSSVNSSSTETSSSATSAVSSETSVESASSVASESSKAG